MQAWIDGTELVPARTARIRFRQSIFEAWAHRCAYCNAPAESLDHVHPKARGGLTVRANLVPACLPCNSSKSADDWINWFRRQTFWFLEREEQIAAWTGNPEGIEPPQEAAQSSHQAIPFQNCKADTTGHEQLQSHGNDQSPQAFFGVRFRLKAPSQPGRWRKGPAAA